MNLLKFGLLGVGAWMLYQRFTSSSSSTEAPADTTTPPPAAAAGAPDLLTLVSDKATRSGYGPLLTFYEWNFFYQQIRGVAGPDFEAAFPGGNPDRKITVEEWYNAALASGLSGIVRRRW